MEYFQRTRCPRDISSQWFSWISLPEFSRVVSIVEIMQITSGKDNFDMANTKTHRKPLKETHQTVAKHKLKLQKSREFSGSKLELPSCVLPPSSVFRFAKPLGPVTWSLWMGHHLSRQQTPLSLTGLPSFETIKTHWRRAAALFWVQDFFFGWTNNQQPIIWKNGGPWWAPNFSPGPSCQVQLMFPGDSSWFQFFRADKPEKPRSRLFVGWTCIRDLTHESSSFFESSLQKPGGFCENKFFGHSKILDVTSSQHL